MISFPRGWGRKLVGLAGLLGLMHGVLGCHAKTADASDPDPHYYQGADFHGKHKKA